MEKLENRLSFGITLTKECLDEEFKQCIFYGHLFSDPELSVEKVKSIVDTIETITDYRKIEKSCKANFKRAQKQATTQIKKDELKAVMLAKTKDWLNYYSLPSQREMLIMTTVLDIEPNSFNRGLFLLFFNNDFSTDSIIDYLKKFSKSLNEDIIRLFLEKYPEIKKEDIVDEKANNLLEVLGGRKTIINQYFNSNPTGYNR
jgi:hypothetical protein